MSPKSNPNRSKSRNNHLEGSKEPMADAVGECVFPQDIMLCILTRLPVKSLLRFKSVCKPWLKLFATPEFMKMHRDKFSSDPKNEAFIIDNLPLLSHHVRTVSLFSIKSNEKKPTNLDCPYPVKIVGCCNGLLCMPFGEEIVLWNPALKLSKLVRLSKVDFGAPPVRVSLGFGYDAEVDDFKVVRIACFEDEPNVFLHNAENVRVGVEVYSAKSDTWKTIEVGLPFKVFETKNDGIVNGNPYWHARVFGIGTVEIPFLDVLLWFDVKKLVFKTVRLSMHIVQEEEGKLFMPHFVDWKGSLAAIVCSKNKERVESVFVWVFDEGGMIWRLNHTVGPIEIKLGAFLKCSNNGKIMGDCLDKKLVVFDTETGCVKVIEIDGVRIYSFKIYGYIESLAYIEGMEPVVVKKEEDEDEDGEEFFHLLGRGRERGRGKRILRGRRSHGQSSYQH